MHTWAQFVIVYCETEQSMSPKEVCHDMFFFFQLSIWFLQAIMLAFDIDGTSCLFPSFFLAKLSKASTVFCLFGRKRTITSFVMQLWPCIKSMTKWIGMMPADTFLCSMVLVLTHAGRHGLLEMHRRVYVPPKINIDLLSPLF